MSGGSFWIIGCGNMAGAMLRRWIETGMGPARFTVVDPAAPASPAGVEVLAEIPDAVAPAAAILLGVKPQLLDSVGCDVARLVGPDTRLISILAGVELATLRSRFPLAREIVRAMPNLPVALGRGVVALCANGGPIAEVSELMAPLGLVEWIADESLLHLVAALASSGPAFLYRFIDTLGEAGARLGLDRDLSARLALATVEGSALLAARSGLPPAELADRVASKGGMTREGLNVLDADEALAKLMVETLAAALKRSVEMGEAAKPA